MARKKWIPKTHITPALIRIRDKKKWQIAFRRYVIEQQACVPYAPFFGLDHKTIRKWFEMQFTDTQNWDGFGKSWQFEHIVPVTFFNFDDTADLKLCWNFINIKVQDLRQREAGSSSFNIITTIEYFTSLYNATGFLPVLQMREKLKLLQVQDNTDVSAPITFIQKHQDLLKTLEHYSAFEFELLNNGRTLAEVAAEAAFLKKF